MPETSAAQPGLQTAGGGRKASAATGDSTAVSPAPPDPERGREGKGNESGDPGRVQPPRPGGVHVSLTTAPGRSPSSATGEGRARGTPCAGRRRPGAPPGLTGRGPGSRGPVRPRTAPTVYPRSRSLSS